MKKNNLLKVSTCVLGLGMMLSGINSMAMEGNNRPKRMRIEENSDLTFENVYREAIAAGKSE